ncbi:APC family permease [Stygiolobus caldivivus]|uniref:Amino acid permease n=1 Tax=Stygiolobus caldivivus TaxID=2824673 RepID=A0A8D5ZKC3_9CREN|nr:amino acid permease [Stygiolobus caldivivus]BCU71596.1 amino acid permease [Stygiolobus caldivivus]
MEKKLFIRESSGLIKDASVLDAIMINLGNMSAGAGIYFVSSALIPGSNAILTSIIGLLLTIPQAIMYTLLMIDIPRTGGDYVWMSRLVSPWIASPLAIGLALQTLAYIALIALSVPSFLSSSLGALSVIYSNPGLSTVSSMLLSPVYTAILAAVVFSIGIAVNIFRPKFGFMFISVTAIIAIISTIVTLASMLYYGHSAFVSSVNSLLAPYNTTYYKIETASSSPFSFLATMSLLPLFVVFIYPWLNASPSIAAEIRGLHKKGKYNLYLSLLFTGLIVTLSLAVMYNVVGINFANNAPSNWPSNAPISPNFLTYAILTIKNPIIDWIVAIGFPFWDLATIGYGIAIFARYVFALSFDRVLPEKFAYISAKFKSPIYIHLLDFAGTMIIILVSIFFASIYDLFGTTLLGMIWFAIVSLGGIFYVKKSFFKDSNASRFRIGKIPVIVIASALSFIYFVYLAYVFITDPALGGNTFADEFIGIAVLVGVIIYILRYYTLKKNEGIDLRLLYQEIPPE